LSKNGLSGYNDLLEQQKLDTEELLTELNQSDFEKLGINYIGDQKKMLKLFSKNQEFSATIIPHSVDTKSETHENKINNAPEAIPPNVIIQNTPGGSSGAHTGLAGVVGGVIGAIAVIVIIKMG
jgi:hypothetical protein